MAPVQKRRVIGIDYGTKRIGLAKSDPLGLFAQPVGTFDRDGLFRALRQLTGEGDVERFVVGYPLSDTGAANAMTEVVDGFIASLREAFPEMEIERIDEHGTSREASSVLVASGRSRRERSKKGRLDAAAACLLLTRFLEARG